MYVHINVEVAYSALQQVALRQVFIYICTERKAATDCFMYVHINVEVAYSALQQVALRQVYN